MKEKKVPFQSSHRDSTLESDLFSACTRHLSHGTHFDRYLNQIDLYMSDVKRLLLPASWLVGANHNALQSMVVIINV